MTRSECYKKCFEDKKNLLSRRIADRENLLKELEQKNKRYAEIKRLISALGSKIAITAILGKTDDLKHMQETISCLSEEGREIVKKAGIPEVVYDCEKCRDTGYVNGKICDCINESARRLMINSLSENIPITDCRFDNFSLSYYPASDGNGSNPQKRMTEIFKICKEYAISFNPSTSKSLLFMGNTGLGKTHLSLSIAYELLNKGYNVIYGSAYNLFAIMEREHFELHTDSSYVEATKCDLLIIDDLGGEFVSPYIQSLVYNIINTRLLARKPTVINTNLSMSEINRIYTPRVASRLMGEYVSRKFIGSDIRQIKNT